MSGRPPPAGRDAYRAWLRFPIRANDENGAGHVDNTVYYGWFDTTWISWLRSNGLRTPSGPSVFIAENRCRYLSELHFPGDVELGLAVERIGGSSIALRFGIFAAEAVMPAAEGSATYVCVDPGTRRPMPLPGAWRLALATLAPGD